MRGFNFSLKVAPNPLNQKLAFYMELRVLSSRDLSHDPTAFPGGQVTL